MKMWQKILSAVLAAFLITSAVLFFNQEEKACCLCNSFRYHSPCLIDLENRKLRVVDLYFPHPAKAAELADPQPQMSTFSFIRLGSVSGYKNTAGKYIEINVPATEITANPALCRACRKQLGGFFHGRYVLADLYDKDNKVLIPIRSNLAVDIRSYRIAVQKEENILKVTIQGILG